MRKCTLAIYLIIQIGLLSFSCTDDNAPITKLSEWDYKYDYNISINGQGRYNCYVKPIDLNNDGHYKTVLVDFDNKPILDRSELVFRELSLVGEGKFEKHLIFPNQDITDLETIDIDNDGIKEIIVCYNEDNNFKIRILGDSPYQTIDTFTVYSGHDFNLDNSWDGMGLICGGVDCDGDGCKDLLLRLGVDRDRFPLSLFAVNPLKRKILWCKYFAAHVDWRLMQFVDIDKDGEPEIIGAAQTCMNPTKLKILDDRYIYISLKKNAREWFCGEFNKDGQLIKLLRGDEAEQYYNSISGDSVIEQFGGYSYRFALKLNGEEVWNYPTENYNYNFAFRPIYLNTDDTNFVFLEHDLTQDLKAANLLKMIDGYTGKDIITPKTLPSTFGAFFVYKDSSQFKINLLSRKKEILVYNESFELLETIYDDGIYAMNNMFDINNDKIPEFAFNDSNHDTYITDNNFRTLFKLDGSLYKVYDFAATTDSSGAIYLPVLHNNTYEIIKIFPKVHSILDYLDRFKWFILSFFVVVLASTTVIALRQKPSLKDMIALGDMLSEFEVGLCLINRKTKNFSFNRYIGSIFDIPHNRLINSKDLSRNDQLYDFLIKEDFGRIDKRTIFNKSEKEFVIKGVNHKFIWGVLNPQSGRIIKKYTTVVCFDQTDFIKGRWALIWGHLAQRVLHRDIKHNTLEIMRNLDLLANTEENAKGFTAVKEKVSSINKMATDLLEGSQLDNPLFKELDVAELCEKVYNRFEDWNDNKINISLKTGNKSLRIKGYENHLLEVLEGILINSLKAIKSEGNIELSCGLAQDLLSFENNGYAVIKIRDNGSGISNHDLDKVYDRNFTRFEKGSGFGLTFSKQVIENHGGKIEIESEINKSTTVTIKLPIYDGKD